MWSHHSDLTLLCEEELSILTPSPHGAISAIEDDTVAEVMEKELQHKPPEKYVNMLKDCDGEVSLSERNDAVAWMGKLHSHFGFGPVCAYLAINYMDRFLASCRLAHFKSKPWSMQLLSVTCVSLAAKMEEVEVPLFMELQVDESRYFFEPKALQHMELMVLITLKWRMHAVTPFSFIDHFINKLNTHLLPPLLLISRSIRIILSVINGFEYLNFRPSEIAAAVAITLMGDTRALKFDEAMGSLDSGLNKERVWECLKVVRNWYLFDGFGVRTSGLAMSVPDSPSAVLDAVGFSGEVSENDNVESFSSTDVDPVEVSFSTVVEFVEASFYVVVDSVEASSSTVVDSVEASSSSVVDSAEPSSPDRKRRRTDGDGGVSQ